jgi:hypothetical protein
VSIYDKIVEDVPALQKGIVYCHTCKATLKVDSAACLAKGWPKCCGQTMSLDEVKSEK